MYMYIGIWLLRQIDWETILILMYTYTLMDSISVNLYTSTAGINGNINILHVSSLMHVNNTV